MVAAFAESDRKTANATLQFRDIGSNPRKTRAQRALSDEIVDATACPERESDRSHCSAHPGVAMPLDLRHLTGRNIDIERPVAADSFLLIFLCHGVMTRRE